MLSKIQFVLIMSLFMLLVVYGVTGNSTEQSLDNNTITKRVLDLSIDGKWTGNGISYSAYRDGESPDKGSLTSREDILEDLQLISERWKLIRVYDASKQAENILEVIRDNNLPLRVMQGIWISGLSSRQQNDKQVTRAIKLANSYPDIIVAVNVGNEIFVDWSAHKVDNPVDVIEYIRYVRSKIRQPVTVVDDYNFWNKPHAVEIARELDFIGLNAYAFWNNQPLGLAMSWTKAIYRDIQERYPDHTIIYSETGWPTSRVYNDDTYEGKLIGKAGEDEQKTFFDEYIEWVNANRIISFYFQAFDENWKGGFDGENAMDKAEKHWGVYRADRTAKKLLQQGRSVSAAQ